MVFRNKKIWILFSFILSVLTDQSSLASGSQSIAEEFPGILKPTVYYFPVFNEDAKSCDDAIKKDLHDAEGKILLTVCPETEDACLLQGACAVIQNQKSYSINYLGTYEGQERFFLIEDRCSYGFGVKNICLDPFYTIAADMSIYKPGQVVFIPAVVGLKLPDGSRHNGYFIIRDKGSHIKGVGRFDFFTGEYSWRDKKNPFKQLKLSDVRTSFPYYLIVGKLAEKILQIRGYPDLPIIRIDPKGEGYLPRSEGNPFSINSD